MLCQKCGKNNAVTHVKRTVNGETTEIHLCASCAKEEGLAKLFDINGFFGSLFGDALAKSTENEVRCEGCGKTFREIAASGKAGCASCYTVFYDRLLPSVRRIHGKTEHVGKVPRSAGEEIRVKRELESLKEQLNAAIAAQEYERCALLRDQIRALEGGRQNG